jgi:signal transduction histidine kinase
MATTTVETTTGLKSDSIGVGGNWILSVADVAPSASVAFALGLLLAAVGLASPFVVIILGIAMFLVAMGYTRLNKWRPATGAPFIWIMDAITPAVGMIMGLLMIVACVFSNIANITLAGSYLLSIAAPNTTFSWWATWLVATALMTGLTAIAIAGLRPSVRLQVAFMVFEYATIVSFAIFAVVYELTDHVHGATGPSWSALNPAASPSGLHGLLLAAVPCAFLFAGWEAPFYVGGESKNRHVAPGVAARVGVSFVLVLYFVLFLCFQGVATRSQMIAHGGNILTFTGSVLAGTGWGRLLSVAVLISVLAVTQTLLIVGSRLVLGAVNASLLPKRLGPVSTRFQTPHVATVVMACIPVTVLIPYLINTSVANRVGDIVSAGGLLYLFMYFAVAVTSSWFSARVTGPGVTTGSRLAALLPSAVGGLVMLAVFCYGLSTERRMVAWSVAVVIAVCVACGLFAWPQAQAAALAERQRLAREMHDVLAHSLSGLVLQLEGARLLAAQRHADKDLTAAVERAHRLAKAGLEDARRAIGLLRGEELPGPERLGDLVQAFQSDTGTPSTLEVSGSERTLDSEVRLALYRVGQEALTNVRKHASPSKVEVHLAYEPGGTHLTVEDFSENGGPAFSLPGAGHGVTGMRERAELLGGELTAIPTECGFRVDLWVPA